MEIVVLQMMNLQLPVQVLLFQELQICVERWRDNTVSQGLSWEFETAGANQ